MSDYDIAIDERVVSAEEKHRQDALRAHAALGQIMQRVPISIRLYDSEVRSGKVEILVSGGSDTDKRATIMLLAEQFDFEYVEEPHDTRQNMVRASGFYDDAPVKFWQLVAPALCDCGCNGGAQ